jgi:hypothetical protein
MKYRIEKSGTYNGKGRAQITVHVGPVVIDPEAKGWPADAFDGIQGCTPLGPVPVKLPPRKKTSKTKPKSEDNASS